MTARRWNGQSRRRGKPGTPEALGRLADQIAEVALRQQELLAEVRQTRRSLEAIDHGSCGQINAVVRTTIASDARPSADAEYLRMLRRLRKFVDRQLPRQATLSVVTKGDGRLLRFGRRTAMHFPQDRAGGYLGYHPSGSLSAIAQLEASRAAGSDFFVLPITSMWWLDHYAGFREHLERFYRSIDGGESVCRVYDLRKSHVRHTLDPLTALVEACERELHREPAILDWQTATAFGRQLPAANVFRPPAGAGARLPYLDATIDIVVLDRADPDRLSEARRVAAYAVLIAQDDDALTARIGWRSELRPKPATSVSIIIPTYDGVRRLTACVRAIQQTLPDEFCGEILVIDDASPLGAYEEICRAIGNEPHVRVVRNATNLGFIRTCNRGSELALGDILVFLNDDTIPLPGWLPPLCTTLRDARAAGAVGGMLLYPDGSLQEAGGVIFRDAQGANIGRNDADPERPIYNHVRDVDYCSGALLATPREVFLQHGGFDPHFCPAYYEDADYSFRLRRSGLRTYYQPASRIVHLEGSSSGTDPLVGTKRYQTINRTKFQERWQSVLSSRPEAPGHYDLGTWFSLTALPGANAGEGRT